MVVRYFIYSCMIHVLLISFIWIGFSASGVRPHNTFTYLGVVQMEEDSDKRFSSHPLDSNMFKESSPAFFAPWLKMRELSKPR